MKIPLSGTDLYAIVDDEFSYLANTSWYLTQNGYAMQRMWDKEKKKHVHRRMHRVINATPDGLFTDHINGNKLDNRASNLRTVTLAENQKNRRMNSNNRTGYPGVHIQEDGRFRARCQIAGKKHHLGVFSDIESAITASKTFRMENGFSA